MLASLQALFDYLPQILAGLIILVLTIKFCQIAIFAWRWIGLNFIFKPPLSPENMSEAIWMKTAPLLIYCIILPIPMIVVFGIWDFKPVSQPAAYYLNLLIGSPLLWIGSLLTITAIHITLLKRSNRKKPKLTSCFAKIYHDATS